MRYLTLEEAAERAGISVPEMRELADWFGDDLGRRTWRFQKDPKISPVALATYLAGFNAKYEPADSGMLTHLWRLAADALDRGDHNASFQYLVRSFRKMAELAEGVAPAPPLPETDDEAVSPAQSPAKHVAAERRWHLLSEYDLAAQRAALAGVTYVREKLQRLGAIGSTGAGRLAERLRDVEIGLIGLHLRLEPQSKSNTESTMK